MIRYVLAAAILSLPPQAHAQQPAHEHSAGMTHGHHEMTDEGSGGVVPSEPGQSAFAAIQEIVAMLDSDPETDWSKVDIEALRQLSASVAESDRHLFEVEPAILWRMTSRGYQGQRDYAADNPPYGVTFHVWIASKPEDKPVLTIHDVTGKELATVEGEARAGMQAIVWDARLGRNRLAEPGTYGVRWRGHDDAGARAFELRPDPLRGAAEEATAIPAYAPEDR